MLPLTVLFPIRSSKRLLQLIEAEEEAAAREAETYYQRQAPLTFKLTGKPVSGEYMAALEKLESGEPEGGAACQVCA